MSFAKDTTRAVLIAASDYVGSDPRFVDGAERALQKAIDLDIGGKNKGRMYEVNINAHPDQFLDWDKSLMDPNHPVRGRFQELAKCGDGNP